MTINASQNIMIDPNEPLILPDRTALTGRIEWFLYSLCLLDYENLPTPMSRIEQFANALVTGEVPNIEPQSRVEEYFLAILTGDVENLPEPESRVEVLLNKLARGEFDLSDVEPIQSRYELLIAYLIKNGGMNDVTYVLHEFLASETHYTMYNTQEKPTKSAILKGQTLVNLVPKKIIDHIASSDWDGYCCLVQNSKQSIDQWRTLQDLKPNTKYYISCYVETFEDVNDRYYCLNNPNTESIFEDSMTVNGVGRYQWLSTTKSELTDEIFIVLRSQNAHARGAIKIRDIMIIEYQEGMENWDIPYFEGMQSVKMPVLTTVGKNLFNYLSYQEKKDYTKYEPEKIIINSPTQFLPTQYDLFLEEGKTYVISCEKTSGAEISVRRSDGSSLLYDTTSTNCKKVFVAENNTFLRLSNREIINEDVWFSNIQIEEGSTATPYEPFKSNILTTSEEVVLRGIGEVQDTLDCLTGEVTERIGEIVLNGSEGWGLLPSWDSNNHLAFIYYFNGKILKDIANGKGDKLPFQTWNDLNSKDIQGFTFGTGTYDYIVFKISKSLVGDLNSFKAWLQQNNVTVQYKLFQETVKTVDLSISDQDGVTVEKLNTFKDITYVSCNVDEGSIYPYVEMEVATSNDEDLAAIGLKLEEKNKVQSKLIEVNDYQSDVIDNVMLGITEIYESI